MHNHASQDYICPICPAIQGFEDERTWIVQNDIVYRDDLVLAFIGSKFVKGHEGYPLVVPLEHFEHLYDLPSEVGHRIMDVSMRLAIALRKLRSCDGMTIAQYNEPAGGQHAFHYHMHVVPRFEGDDFDVNMPLGQRSAPEDRVPYAQALRDFLRQNP